MGTIAYNAVESNLTAIYRATSGGTVFSANIIGANFDYFTDTPTVNDAIYFGMTNAVDSLSDFKFNVGTPMAGTDVVIKWEYFNRSVNNTLGAWVEIPNLTDNTNAFTTTGINVVKFPPAPYFWFNQPTNLAGIYIRARLVSFTTVTEGGANATTIPTKRSGLVSTSGFSTSDYLYAKDLYDWFLVNAPEVPVFRRANYYEFPVGGTYNFLKSINEVILFGNGHSYMSTSLPDAEFGIQENNIGRYGSVIMVCGFSGGTVFGPSTGTYYNTKMMSQSYYDQYQNTFIQVPSSFITTRAGYAGTKMIGSIAQEAGYFSGATQFINSFSSGGSNITISAFADNNNLLGANLSSADGIFNAYNNTIYNYRGVNLFPSAYYFSPNSTSYGGITLNLFDCTKLPSPSTDLPNAISLPPRHASAITSNIARFKYYDDSSGTYTDYTTQAQNSTAGDVPLSGDVGDIFYIGTGANNRGLRTEQFVFRFECPSQTNDYEYVWEFYNNTTATWTQFTNAWDRTENFTKTDEVIYLQHTTANILTLSATTIDGFSSVWVRARIVTKGTGTPTTSRVRWNVATGHFDTWRCNEHYSLDIKVNDRNKNPIQGATVKVDDVFDATKATLTTDSNGNITTINNLLVNVYQFDPLNPHATIRYKQTLQTPHTITVSANGYQTKVVPIEILSKTNQVITLEKQVDTALAKGQLVINADPANSQSDVFV